MPPIRLQKHISVCLLYKAISCLSQPRLREKMFTPRKIFLTLQKSAVVIEIEINFKLLYSILSSVSCVHVSQCFFRVSSSKTIMMSFFCARKCSFEHRTKSVKRIMLLRKTEIEKHWIPFRGHFFLIWASR